MILPACCARAASGHVAAGAAEQRDELAASHSITSSAVASSVGGTARGIRGTGFYGISTRQRMSLTPP
jgi:hypothetical protein